MTADMLMKSTTREAMLETGCKGLIYAQAKRLSAELPSVTKGTIASRTEASESLSPRLKCKLSADAEESTSDK